MKLKNSLGLDIDLIRDWKILCVSFMVLVFAILFIDTYIYYNGRTMSTDAVNSSDSALALDYTKMDKVLGVWRLRGENYNKVLSGKERLVDPSL